MHPPAIVKAFDVLKYIHTRVNKVFVFAMMNPLGLDCSEYGFGARVVETISLATHAGNDPMLEEKTPKAFARVLRASVRMKYQRPRFHRSVRERLFDGLYDERCSHVRL